MLPRLALILSSLLLTALLCAAETSAPATRTIVLVRHGCYLPSAFCRASLSFEHPALRWKLDLPVRMKVS